MARFIIVGGGLLGMLTARELVMSGSQVTLIEKGQMARESSWAGGGIISPLYPWRYPDSVTKLATASQRIYPKICADLRLATGIDPEYSPTGMLLIAPSEMQAALEWADQHNKNLKLIARDRIRTLEPALAAPSSKAIWMPDIAHVRNPRLARALIKEIQQFGVSLLLEQNVTGLQLHNDRVSGVKTSAGNFAADAVVVCAGAWTEALLNGVISAPAIHPVKGQMLLFKTEPGVIQRIVLEENRYIIPRMDGRVLFGSTLEDTGFEKLTTQAAREELYAIATERFPVLKKYPIEKHWAGLRPGSPAGIPYITGHPDLSGLFINAGHFRNGVVLGPASARLCADLILGRKPLLDPAPYSLLATRE